MLVGRLLFVGSLRVVGRSLFVCLLFGVWCCCVWCFGVECSVA